MVTRIYKPHVGQGEYVSYYHMCGSWIAYVEHDDMLVDAMSHDGESSECVWLIPTREAFERAS